jgi:DNA-binding MarR family transcriptional regulator
MRAVLRHPNEPLSRIAEELGMDRTSMYRAIEALEKRQWITSSDGKDNRSRSVSVTRRGEHALTQADPGWEKTQVDIVDRFGRKKWQIFVGELQRLVDCTAGVDSTGDKSGK